MKLFDVDEGLGILYRYDYITYRDTVELNCYEYPIVKKTEKGHWIRVYGLSLKNDQKFVNNTCRKQWANETKEDAIYSFIKRKERQTRIMTNILKNVKYVTQIAKGLI